MGYWNYHPLGGDNPQDQIANFITVLFPEVDEIVGLPLPTLQKRILEKLDDIIAEPMDFEIYDDYVLPFVLAELHIQIQDEQLSARLKGMIREMDDDVLSSKIQDTLYRIWDRLMDGTISFDEYTSEGIDSLSEDLFK